MYIIVVYIGIINELVRIDFIYNIETKFTFPIPHLSLGERHLSKIKF